LSERSRAAMRARARWLSRPAKTGSDAERVAVERGDAADPAADGVAEVEDALTVTSDPAVDPPEAFTETDGAGTPAGDAFSETVGLVGAVVVVFTVTTGAVTLGAVTVGALTVTVGTLIGGGALRGTEIVGVLTGGGACTVTVGVVTGADTVTEGKLSDAAGDAPTSIASNPPANTPQTAILVLRAFAMRAIPNSERPSVHCGRTSVQ
jgi:hypothetical protein